MAITKPIAMVNFMCVANIYDHIMFIHIVYVKVPTNAVSLIKVKTYWSYFIITAVMHDVFRGTLRLPISIKEIALRRSAHEMGYSRSIKIVHPLINRLSEVVIALILVISRGIY